MARHSDNSSNDKTGLVTSEFEDDFPFWRFSLEYYGCSGTASALLDIQDRLGADVNMVLFGLWRACEQRTLTTEEYRALDSHIEDWRRFIVLPVRDLRRALKTAEGPRRSNFYAEAKVLELRLERLQQRYMQQAAHLAVGAVSSGVKEAAMNNLAAYGGLLSKPMGDETMQLLSDRAEEFVQGRR